MEPDKRSRLRWWIVPLLIVAYFAINLGANEEQQGATTSAIMLYTVTAAALALVGLIWLRYRRTVPKEARRVESEVERAWRARTWAVETDNTSAALSFLFVGVVMESIPLLEGSLYGLISVSAYITLCLAIFLRKRDSFRGDQLLSTVFFLTSVLAIPFSFLALQNPNILAGSGIIPISASRSIAFMLVMSNQAAAVYSTVLMLSIASRTSRLRSRGLSQNSMMDLQKFILASLKDSPKFGGLKGAFFDIPIARRAFIEGNFDVVVAIGWSVIDRALESLTGTRDDVQGAQQLGLYSPGFKNAYRTRNRVVHDGYKPDASDAIGFVVEMKVLMESLDPRRPKAKQGSAGDKSEIAKRETKPSPSKGPTANRTMAEIFLMVLVLGTPSILLVKWYLSLLGGLAPANLASIAQDIAYLGVIGFLVTGFFVFFLPPRKYFSLRFVLLFGALVFAFSIVTALMVGSGYLKGQGDPGSLLTPLISLVDAPLFLLVMFVAFFRNFGTRRNQLAGNRQAGSQRGDDTQEPTNHH